MEREPVDLTIIAQLLIAAVGGGASVKLLELILGERRLRRKEASERSQDELDKDERIVNLVIDKLTEQRNDALSQVETLRHRIENLELEIQGLRMAQGRDPFPRWMVDLNGCYMYVNSCFEEQFLRPEGRQASDIIGKKHEDFWPPEFAEKLHTLDALAMRRPDGRARATVIVKGRLITVYKLPVRHKPSGAVLAYEGWVTDVDEDSTRELKL